MASLLETCVGQMVQLIELIFASMLTYMLTYLHEDVFLLQVKSQDIENMEVLYLSLYMCV